MIEQVIMIGLPLRLDQPLWSPIVCILFIKKCLKLLVWKCHIISQDHKTEEINISPPPPKPTY